MDAGMHAGGMALSMGFWLLTNAVLWIVPLWFLLPRGGLNRYLSLLGAIPMAGIVLLWVLALKRWPGDNRGA
jgi:hypothetical protein